MAVPVIAIAITGACTTPSEPPVVTCPGSLSLTALIAT